MRRYYELHQVAPDARFVIKHLAGNLRSDARNEIFRLFPYGYVKQACKIARMKRPWPRAQARRSGNRIGIAERKWSRQTPVTSG
jgi:DsrC like protein